MDMKIEDVSETMENTLALNRTNDSQFETSALDWGGIVGMVVVALASIIAASVLLYLYCKKIKNWVLQ